MKVTTLNLTKKVDNVRLDAIKETVFSLNRDPESLIRYRVDVKENRDGLSDVYVNDRY